jgi:DNA-binding MarR family transcriptional regulator
LVRTPSLSDRRSHTVVLTPSGIAKNDECRKRMVQAMRRLNARLGSSVERDILREALGRLDAAIVEVSQHPPVGAVDPGLPPDQ